IGPDSWGDGRGAGVPTGREAAARAAPKPALLAGRTQAKEKLAGCPGHCCRIPDDLSAGQNPGRQSGAEQPAGMAVFGRCETTELSLRLASQGESLLDFHGDFGDSGPLG